MEEHIRLVKLVRHFQDRLANLLNPEYKNKVANKLCPELALSFEAMRNDSVEKIIEELNATFRTLNAENQELLLYLVDKNIIESVTSHEAFYGYLHGEDASTKGPDSPWYKTYFNLMILLYSSYPKLATGGDKGDYEYGSKDNCIRFFESFLFHNSTTKEDLVNVLSIQAIQNTVFAKKEFGRFNYQERTFWNPYNRAPFAKQEAPPEALKEIIYQSIEKYEASQVNAFTFFGGFIEGAGESLKGLGTYIASFGSQL
ncbi:hypothetical protein [Legionella shakespearei]|uniref:Uncharacterized protein n=1 Tax=Legionella shakespearei DSM 23087 TaxID=1122169 RepID=A0A0W0Z795_9GAMM|nr:hypothetical protein [Legionella shakespearei]KTD64994.1 hypothetical protein Lsha_0363 [Legionella shakespearei DSM 23087]